MLRNCSPRSTVMTKRDYYDLLIQCTRDGTFPSHVGPKCLYRSPSNRRCAIGVLIPDEDYKPFWDVDQYPVDDLPPQILEAITPEGMRLADLLAIQRVHDTHAITWDAEDVIDALGQLSCFQE